MNLNPRSRRFYKTRRKEGIYMRITQTIKVLTTGIVLVAGVFLANPTTFEAKAFTDLPKSGSHAEGVKYLNDLKVYDYKSGNLLKGNSPVSRAETSKILYNLNKDDLKKTRTYKSNFKDLTSKTPYYKEMVWSYEVGILDGDTNGKFNPKSNLTRSQMAKVLVNTYNLKSSKVTKFKDVAPTHWSFNYVSILAGNGVTTGDSKGNFLPITNVTLNQLSTFLYRIESKAKPSTPVVTKPGTEYKTFDDLKVAAKKLYESPEFQPKDVVLYTSTNLKDKFTNYYFQSSDISLDIQGYTFYGRLVRMETEEISKGVFRNTLKIVNDRYEEDEVIWNKKMDKAEEYIVANYKLETDYDVVFAINNFVVGQIEYGGDFSEDHPYLEWRGNMNTCTGYSDMMAELLERFGIESRLLTGDAHAWNAVKVGGSWYYTDATFTDNTRKDDSFILFTQSYRLETFQYPDSVIETSFKATDVPFQQSMAKPYNYATDKKK